MRRQGGHSQMHMAEVVLKNLKKVYPNTEKKKKKGEPEKKNDLQITDEGVVAVQDFNRHIADTEFIVLVGPSGCGKSTTLRMIAGLEDISGGELYIDGKLMNDVEPKDRDIAMVFQSYALYPHMTVYGNMAFSLKLKKVPKDEIDRRVRQAAEILDITQYLDRKPKAAKDVAEQDVVLGVRPDHIMLCADGVKGKVDVSEMMGSSVHLHVAAEGKDVIVIVPTNGAAAHFPAGSEVNMIFGGNVAHVFSKEKYKILEW